MERKGQNLEGGVEARSMLGDAGGGIPPTKWLIWQFVRATSVSPGLGGIGFESMHSIAGDEGGC